MTSDETKELSEIVRAVEAAKLDHKGLDEWAKEKRFKLEGPQTYNWWHYNTAHGQVAYSFRGFDGVGRIVFCTYIPKSTKQVVSIVFRGSTPSGVSLPRTDLDSLFSKNQIESHVGFVCVAEADWPMDPAEVTRETRIVEDLLGDDDELKRDLLDQIFLELNLWFDFESPDLDETIDTFDTVGNVIDYVQRTHRAR